MAALACGMIAVGSCNGEVTSTILQTMMERSEADLKDTYSRYLGLGLALCYLGEKKMRVVYVVWYISHVFLALKTFFFSSWDSLLEDPALLNGLSDVNQAHHVDERT